MQNLGVTRDEIDAVFISHLHMDHTGGLKAQNSRAFELTPDDAEPLSVDAFVPVEMSHASANVKVVTGPLEIAQASTAGQVGCPGSQSGGRRPGDSRLSRGEEAATRRDLGS